MNERDRVNAELAYMGARSVITGDMNNEIDLSTSDALVNRRYCRFAKMLPLSTVSVRVSRVMPSSHTARPDATKLSSFVASGDVD